MKRNFVVGLLAVGLCILKVSAQTEKGTLLLGGNANFQTVSGSSVLTVSPNLGKFFLKDLALGLRANLTTTSGSTGWYIGPFGRCYFAQQYNGKFFAQVGLNLGNSSGSDTQFGAGVGAGYALFLNQSVALEFGANYDKAGHQTGIFSLNIGFQIHLRR